MTDPTFGLLLRKTREGCNRTQGWLAKQVGISNIYLSDIERAARHPPSVDRITAIAAALGVDAAPLIEAAMETAFAGKLTFTSAAARKTAAALLSVWSRLTDEQYEQLQRCIAQLEGGE